MGIFAVLVENIDCTVCVWGGGVRGYRWKGELFWPAERAYDMKDVFVNTDKRNCTQARASISSLM